MKILELSGLYDLGYFLTSTNNLSELGRKQLRGSQY